MAAALRLAPADLLGCDDEVLEHLVTIAERERTHALWALEVQALTAELVHALWRVTVRINQKKGSKEPNVLNLPRPWRKESRPARPRITIDELASRLGRGG